MRKQIKPKEVIIYKDQLKQICDYTRKNIYRKLDSAKLLINHDPEMSAGLYTYAIEEFGKLLLLRQCAFNNDKCKIMYEDQFIKHTYKFELAFDYLRKNNAGQCITLSQGSFSQQSYSWKNFDIGLLPGFESRLSIFYSDFLFEQNRVTDIVHIPSVDHGCLKDAIDGLTTAVNNLK